MNEIKKVIKIPKVEYTEKETVQFETVDKQIFDFKEDAVKHEEYLLEKTNFFEKFKIKSIYFDTEDCNEKYVLFVKEEDKESFIEGFKKYFWRTAFLNFDKFLYNTWVILSNDLNGESCFWKFFKVENKIKSIEIEIKKLNEISRILKNKMSNYYDNNK